MALGKVCHILTNLNDRYGSSRRTICEVEHLKKIGYQTDIIVGGEINPETLTKLRSRGWNVYPVKAMRKKVAPLDDFLAYLDILKILRRNRYDLVHTHLAKGGALGRLAAWRAGVPCIVHGVHGCSFPDFKHPLARLTFLTVERLLGKCTTGFIFVGRDLMERYRRAGVGNPSAYHLIYTGRDLSSFVRASRLPEVAKTGLRRTLGLNPEDVVIGLVARLVPGKGHLVTLMALKILQERFPRLRVLFVGDPDPPTATQLRDQVETLIDTWGLKDRVTLLGYQGDIASYYALFNILVMPSDHEGLPNVLVEAAVMQLPVVAFACDGVEEILGDLATSVPQKNVATFISALELEVQRSLSGEDLKESREARAQEVTRIWSQETMLADLEKLYQEMFSGVKIRGQNGLDWQWEES